MSFRAFPDSLPRDHGPTILVLDMLDQVQNSMRSIGISNTLIKSYKHSIRGNCEEEGAETSTLARVREDIMVQFFG